MSATVDSDYRFNSGIMVIEPSNCTFKFLMDYLDDFVSYDNGNQGYLNEVFVWWHWVLKRVNAIKIFPKSSTNGMTFMDELYRADPPKVFTKHYVGWKPWLCYRVYDCNWNVEGFRVYASDVAHERWLKVYDTVDERLQRFCGLTKERKGNLEWALSKARELGFPDEHLKINITDPRREHLVA